MIELIEFHSLFAYASKCLSFRINIPLKINHSDFSLTRVINKRNKLDENTNDKIGPAINYIEYKPDITLYSIFQSKIIEIEYVRVYEDFIRVHVNEGYLSDLIFFSKEKAESYLYLS